MRFFDLACLFGLGLLPLSILANPLHLDSGDDLADGGSESRLRQRPLERASTYSSDLVPLEFRENAKRKPRRKNLKKAKLLRKMGADFDSRWMSIDRPASGPDDLVRVSVTENQVAELVEQVSELNLEEELEEMVSGVGTNDLSTYSEDEDDEDEDDADSGSSKALRGEMIAVFKQWLVKKSSCPVAFRWHDLGEYFWPRYVVQGECQKTTEGTSSSSSSSSSSVASTATPASNGCSWPRGMKCVPGRAQTLHILRWHCRRRRMFYTRGSGEVEGERAHKRQQGNRHKCRWYKVPYPVTTSCRCSCR